MKVSRRHCPICKQWFQPNPLNPHRQQTCSSPACQKKRRAENNRQWQIKNPGYGKSRKEKIHRWAKEYPNYWQHYRAKNSAYRKRDNRRRVLARQKTSVSAKQDSVRKFSLEKLKDIRENALKLSAKQDAVKSVIAGISALAEFLIWKELSAKQDDIAKYAPGEQQYEYATTNLGRDKAIGPG